MRSEINRASWGNLYFTGSGAVRWICSLASRDLHPSPTEPQARSPQRRSGEKLRQGTSPLGLARPVLDAHDNRGGTATDADSLRALRHGALNNFAEFCVGSGYGPVRCAHRNSLPNSKLIMVIGKGI